MRSPYCASARPRHRPFDVRRSRIRKRDDQDGRRSHQASAITAASASAATAVAGAFPKPTEEDPAAPQALRAIRESPTYRLAEQDAEFIARADIRGPRLEIEYLKADVILAEQHIDHTIVVYGSTRITEPGAARHKVEALRASVRAQPGNEELSLHLAAAERILAKSHYYDVAREFGRLVGGKRIAPRHRRAW